MGRVLAILAAAVLLFAGAVWYSQRRPPAPLGYSGLIFTRLTPAASGRTPSLDRGALVQDVEADSPADKAGITKGAVIATIEGHAVRTARQASDRIARYRVGETAALTYYDGKGDRLKEAAITFAAVPDPALTKRYSVYPPRTLAKDPYKWPPLAANAAWSNRIARGATTKPMKLQGFGTGRCNGLAPDKWKIIAYEPDGRLIHVAMPGRFQQALLASVPQEGAPLDVIRALLQTRFGSPATLSLPRAQPFGFTLVNFGNDKGGTGFVLYRIKDGRVQMWVAAAAAAEADWSLPIAGAVAFALNCGPADNPREPAMAVTSVSAQCLSGKCQDSDLAASYMAALKLGYVHGAKGQNYLINPRRDYWIAGEQGPGFYHQVGGENEKLLPGRMNDAPTSPSL